jgi:vacuolar-type H+-ATPase subunit D/Vma8
MKFDLKSIYSFKSENVCLTNSYYALIQTKGTIKLIKKTVKLLKLKRTEFLTYK